MEKPRKKKTRDKKILDFKKDSYRFEKWSIINEIFYCAYICR